MNANYLHTYASKPSKGHYAGHAYDFSKVKPMTKEEVADIRAWLRSGLTEEEYDRRKAAGTL